ncbi:MAG: LysE family translocator, partial [Verrucomicrobiota bacterium]
YGFIREAAVTSASEADGRMLRHLVTKENTSSEVWADSAYRSKRNEKLDSEAKERKFGGIVRKAVLINVLNPKLSIFFLAFLPPFIDSSSVNAHLQMGLLSAFFTLMTLGVFMIYGLCASRVRRALVESKTLLAWLQKSFAVCFAFVGLKLATERQ